MERLEGNPKCHEMKKGFDMGYKTDGCTPMKGMFGEGMELTKPAGAAPTCAAGDMGSFTQTCSGGKGSSASTDIKSEFDAYVFVKGANGGNLYFLEAGKTYEGLIVNNKRQDISHVEYCFECPEDVPEEPAAPEEPAEEAPVAKEAPPAPEDVPEEPAAPAEPVVEGEKCLCEPAQTDAKVCLNYAKRQVENEVLDPEVPRPEKCVMKRASELLNFEPNFPMGRPDVYIETEIGDGTRFQFYPHDYPFYEEHTLKKGEKEGSLPFNNRTHYEILFQEQEKLGGQGFKLRYVSKNGPGEWNSCKYSPIAFDLDGDGKLSMITSDKGFQIDITGDGDVERLKQWFAPWEGILVDAHNEVGLKNFKKGKITGNHLMGDMAGKYTDGFAKLATYDENCDDKLTGSELDGLFIWKDKNSNLKLDDDELFELSDFNIVELSVIHDDLKSHATLGDEDKSEMLMQDLWFDEFGSRRRLRGRSLDEPSRSLQEKVYGTIVNGECSCPLPKKAPPAPVEEEEDEEVPSGTGIEGTCKEDDYVGDGPNTSNKKYSCCAGEWMQGSKTLFGSCATSSCHVNFGMDEITCHNYGSPQNPKDGSKPKGGNGNGGSANCPYTAADKAICDVSMYTEHNNDKNCREGGGNHCLGEVKCGTKGVSVPKKGNSDGTAEAEGDEDGACDSEKYPAGTLVRLFSFTLLHLVAT